MKIRPDAEPPRFSRRDGLKLLGAYAGGAILASCRPRSATHEVPTFAPTTPFSDISPATQVPTRKVLQEGDTKVENGVTYEWNAELNGWFRPLTPEAIPLLDLRKESNDIGLPDQMWLEVRVDKNVPGVENLGVLSHPPRFEDPNRNVDDFNDIFSTRLLKRLGNIRDSAVLINNGEISIPFTTSEGEQSWLLGPNTKVIVNFVKEPGEGFSQWKDPYDAIFQSKIYTDAGGNLRHDIFSQTPLNELSDEQIVELILFAPASVIDHTDLTTLYYNQTLSSFVAWAMNDKYPFFEITGNQ